MKFEAAYFRTSISAIRRAKSRSHYAKYHAGGVPSNDDYRIFQD